jgi:oxygen-independent coproporphyrinogen-3 oxidase
MLGSGDEGVLFSRVEREINKKWDIYSQLARNGCVRNPLDDYIVVTYPPRTCVDDLLPDQRKKYSEEIIKTIREADKSVKIAGYIHFPFCSRRCTFCHYYSNGNSSREYIRTYIQTLRKEIQILGKNVSPKELSSLFIGGGTPSLMTPLDLHEILDEITHYFTLSPHAEVTMDLHPELVRETPGMYLKEVKETGITRVNVGLQSADQKILDASNRGHTVEEAVNLHEICKKIGFTTNIDIVWGGLPTDSIRSFLKSLELAFSQNPDTVTTYHMWLKPQTPEFQRYTESPFMYPNWIEALRERVLSYVIAEKYNYIPEYLDWFRRIDDGRGYQQQKDKWGTNRTILISFGPGTYAWSFTTSDNNFMYWHPFSLQHYQKLVDDHQLPIERCARLNNNESSRRHIIFRLKSGEIPKDVLELLLVNAPDIRLDIMTKMKKLVDLRLVEDTGTAFKLTDVGSWIGDEVASVFTSPDILKKMESKNQPEEKKYEWYVNPNMIAKMQKLVGDKCV